MNPLEALGIGGSLFGLLGGMFNKPKVDLSGLYNSANDYLNYAKSTYGDPNSMYYTKAMATQYNNLNDMYLAGINKSIGQMYSNGVSPSAKLVSDYVRNANTTAGEQANQFANQMYLSGQNFINDAYKTNVNAHQIGAEIQNQANVNSYGTQSSIYSGMAGLGMNLLGQYSQSLNNNNTDDAFLSARKNAFLYQNPLNYTNPLAPITQNLLGANAIKKLYNSYGLGLGSNTFNFLGGY